MVLSATAHSNAATLAALHVLLSQEESDVSTRSSAPRHDIFNEVIHEAMHAHFDTRTIRAIQYTTNSFLLGFQAAKEGRQSTARTEFARADELFALQKQNYEASMVVFLNCITLPYRAYYEYSCGRFETSIAKTLEAIDNICQLEEKIPIFHMARIQQLHNMSRVEFKRGEAEVGAVLVREILGYLGAGTTPNISGDWRSALLDRTPPSLQADMFGQLFVEMVSNLCYQPDIAKRRRLFELAFGESCTWPVTLAVWPGYKEWLVAYEALLFADEAEYLPRLLAYLHQPDHAFDFLKLALLWEFKQRLTVRHGSHLLLPLIPVYARRHLWISTRYVSILE